MTEQTGRLAAQVAEATRRAHSLLDLLEHTQALQDEAQRRSAALAALLDTIRGELPVPPVQYVVVVRQVQHK